MEINFNEPNLSDEPYIVPTELTEIGFEIAPGYENVRIVGYTRSSNQSYTMEIFDAPVTEYTDEIMGHIKVSEAGVIIYPTTLNEYLKNAEPQEIIKDIYRIKTPYDIVYYIEATPTPAQAAIGYKVARCKVFVHYNSTFIA